MDETTLKDESVIEIGQTVTKGFNDLVNSGKSVLINPVEINQVEVIQD